MEFSVKIYDQLQAPITGGAASTALSIIQKKAANPQYLYDFNDSTFKVSTTPPTTPTAVLTEVDATNIPGLYNKFIDITSWPDGFYSAHVEFDNGTLVIQFDSDFYVKGGKELTERAGENEGIYHTFTVVANAGNNGSTFKTNLSTGVDDDHYADMLCTFTSGDLSVSGAQIKRVVSYNATTQFLTVNIPFTATPVAGVTGALINR